MLHTVQPVVLPPSTYPNVNPKISALTEERNNAEDDLAFTQDNLTQAAEAGSMLVAQNQKLESDRTALQNQLDTEKEEKESYK